MPVKPFFAFVPMPPLALAPKLFGMEHFREIGPALRRIRKRRGWSQGVLAEKAGLDITTVSRIETQTNPPAIESLDKLLAALEADLHELADSIAETTPTYGELRPRARFTDLEERVRRLEESAARPIPAVGATRRGDEPD